MMPGTATEVQLAAKPRRGLNRPPALPRPPQTRSRVSHLSFAIAMKEMMDGPVTMYDIEEATGWTLTTCSLLLRACEKKKVCHISAWEPDKLGRDTTAVFSLGTGTKARKRKQSSAQRGKSYRDRLKMKTLQAATAGATFQVGCN